MSLIICDNDMMTVPQRERSLSFGGAEFLEMGGSLLQWELSPFVSRGSPLELDVTVFEKSLGCMTHKLY